MVFVKIHNFQACSLAPGEGTSSQSIGANSTDDDFTEGTDEMESY